MQSIQGIISLNLIYWQSINPAITKIQFSDFFADVGWRASFSLRFFGDLGLMGAGWVQWTRRICCSPSQLPDSANQDAEEIITLLWHKDFWHWLFYTDINTLRGGYWFNSTANILSPCGIGKF